MHSTESDAGPFTAVAVLTIRDLLIHRSNVLPASTPCRLPTRRTSHRVTHLLNSAHQIGLRSTEISERILRKQVQQGFFRNITDTDHFLFLQESHRSSLK
ncbi:hypothetical protein NE237_021477 [Protea cynaroides]|uniref:Uncharacterized protein n=1 Tax=Protea cynaroides TaxID=273540 RepID=A0A9Q0H813_9MAGN|nr:hypothetical protein NE237_021477 [Protea cynaroides]